jgi:uncharacterized protein YuzB (UPF0349 family)
MLEQLLKMVATGGIHSYAQLARDLNVSEALLEQMLEELERMGYLQRMDATCDSHCDHCGESTTCSVHGPGQLWELTDKKMPV